MTGAPAPRESTVVHATPDEIWSILTDPEALRRVIPAIESLSADPDSPPHAPRFHGVLAARAFLVTIRADITVELLDAEPQRHVLLSLSGRTRGMNGEFLVRAPLDFTAVPDGSTRVDYSTDVQVSGQIASFGRSAGDAIRSQVSELVTNLEVEIARQRG